MKNYVDFNLVLVIIIVLWVITGFVKKPITYEDYIKKSINYATILNKRKSIEILEDALKSNGLTRNEIYGINIALSRRYYSFKDYNNAIKYFKSSLELINDEKFCFDKYYITMLECYIRNGNINDGKDLYNNLIARESYDSKFGIVKKFSHRINEK